MKHKQYKLDLTLREHRLELASAFGERAAWEATIVQLTAREAKAHDKQRKQRLRLLLLSAHTQLSLLNAA